ncbi:Phosphatidylinositol 4-phosphate 5-kinase 4 [Raphanus sativus]|nr:Phosphatidylinositol 4-phosphate 5-kinase 4 [Raphanus sativus]
MTEENDDETSTNTSSIEELYHAERVLPNGDYYTGPWYDSFPHGQGYKYIWTDGCMYIGGGTTGRLWGKGSFGWPSGPTGQWVMNLKHGHGIKSFANGDFYDGEWRRCLQEAQGKYRWRDESYYIGEWKNGMICGKGTFVWTDGSRYTMGFGMMVSLVETGRSSGTMGASTLVIGLKNLTK